MEKDNINQLKQIKRVFVAPMLICVLLLFLLIVYYLLKLEYNERIVYGQLKNGKLKNIYWENESIESPPNKQFHCQVIVDKRIYDYQILNADQSFAISNQEKQLIENIAIGDSVKVKVLNEKQVKILEWKKKIINKKNNFWDILWIWVLISTLTIIPISLFIKIYKIYKQ